MTPLDKREAFLALIAKGWVSVCLDARRDGVVLPERFRTQGRLILQYGLDMPVPIDDLDATPDGIKATLSFDRAPQATFIPWHAVYLLAHDDGQGVVYENDVPPDLRTDIKQAGGKAAGSGTRRAPGGRTRRSSEARANPAGGTTPRPALSMVPPSDAEKPAPAHPGKRPTLRLVK